MNINTIITLKKYFGLNNEEIIARAYLAQGIVVFDGDKEIINMLKNGIQDPTNKIKLVYPEDGEKFLQAMLNFFDSPYLYATNK